MKTSKLFAVATLMLAVFPFTLHSQDIASSDTLMKHVRYLASSQCEGRLAGTDGFIRAAEYVVNALASYGAKPYKDEWLQLFEIETNQVENCTFNTYVNSNDARTLYVLGKDFVCAGMTGRGYADANVVFCGYGIDDKSYNEYKKVDAQGKIVMVLSGTPNHLPSNIAKQYASLRDKARVAQRHGAVALVVVNLSQTCRPNEVQSRVYSGEEPHLPTFPILFTTRQLGETLLQDERFSLDSVMNLLQSDMAPHSFHLLKKFEINVNAQYHPKALTANIMGVIEGKDAALKREYIVVGAHLDHVGMQGNTCLFPGADDNASGVAAVLETARMLANTPGGVKRSVLFVFFSGAESQHLGSRIFVSNFDRLENVEAFLNAECVGNGDSIAVLGNKRFPDLWASAHRADSAVTHFMVHGYKTVPNGDAAAFYAVGIPSLVFTNYNGNRYAHVPSDIPENIDRNMLQKSATLLYHTLLELGIGDYQGRSIRSRRYRFE